MPREKRDEVIRDNVTTDLMLTDPQAARVAIMIAEYLEGRRRRRSEKRAEPESDMPPEQNPELKISRNQRLEMMRHAFSKEDPEPDRAGLVANSYELRKHILSMSLFPNLYNGAFLERQMPKD